jgi:hypothetical protein
MVRLSYDIRNVVLTDAHATYKLAIGSPIPDAFKIYPKYLKNWYTRESIAHRILRNTEA